MLMVQTIRSAHVQNISAVFKENFKASLFNIILLGVIQLHKLLQTIKQANDF